MDYGPNPFVTNINWDTKQNNYYRSTLWTAEHLQIMLISLPQGQRSDVEINSSDQFINIVEGESVIETGLDKDNLDFRARVSNGYAIMLAANTWHRFYNIGNTPIKLYVIYGPPQWPKGTEVETMGSGENGI